MDRSTSTRWAAGAILAGVLVATGGGPIGCERSPAAREAEARKEAAKTEASREKEDINDAAKRAKQQVDAQKEEEKKAADRMKEDAKNPDSAPPK
jgi:flagellar motility protein MotE (MotC chaperone)